MKAYLIAYGVPAVLLALTCSFPSLAQHPSPPPACVCNPGPETFALIGLPVVHPTRSLTGIILVAWHIDAHMTPAYTDSRGVLVPPQPKPRSLYVLVEFDSGAIEWLNVTELRVDVEKRKKQRELMMPQFLPPQGHQLPPPPQGPPPVPAPPPIPRQTQAMPPVPTVQEYRYQK